MAEEARRLTAILRIDAVGYSRLMGDDEAGAHELFRRHRDETVLPGIARHGGRIVNTAGDGFLVEFSSAVNAVSAGLEMQEGIARINAGLPPNQVMAFRTGINLGEVIVEGDDIFGTHVNIAARVETLAEPGDLLVTRAVRDQAQGRIEALFEDYGAHRVKNIETPVEVFRVTRQGAPPRPMAPHRRRRIVAAVAAAVIVLGAGGLIGSGLVDPLALLDPSSPFAMRPSVAVLPFTNQTPDPANAQLAEGFAEDVIGTLGRYATLTVMSRNATAAFKGRTVRPSEVCRALNCRYVVEGSFRQSGDQRRISAQLIEADSGVVLWTGTYDAATQDLGVAHDAMVREIAGKLAARVVQVEGSRTVGKPTDNLAAYELLLRARVEIGHATRAGHVAARGLLDRALQMDPAYAELYVAYSQVMYDRGQRGWTEQPVESFEEAERLANRALALDPDSASAHAQLARIHVVFGRYEQALAEADRAITLNPSDPMAQYARGSVLLWLGRPSEAASTIMAIQRVEPQLGAEALFSLGSAYLLLGNHKQAQALIDGNIARYPDYAYLWLVLAASSAGLGETAKAEWALGELRKVDPFFELARFGSRFRQDADRERIVALLKRAGLK